ncbi:hypothetical protein [Mongoliitalea daihaiensis]|uniref:hypothetical protein n=1 Tax=Mongoliitalea daihaiensis TaxID=2782006 RepID=UPI001F209512|nr:hypothetical protein [Mongoliitalea daihaiensis]UJP63827.1 hypothetical protein IPZ59_13435 [Mongoliitalea daihaiensis]
MRIYFVFVLLLLIGCQSTKELHYLKQGDNYYRLKINQHAFLSSSRYMSGEFDQDAVNYFFSEISRPDSAKIISKPIKKILPNGNSVLNDKSLVFILSTNSNEVTDQIGAFSSNEETLKTITSITRKESISVVNNIRLEREALDKKNKDLAELTKEYIKLIETNPTGDALTVLLSYINHIGFLNGRKTAFENLSDAQNWFINEY